MPYSPLLVKPMREELTSARRPGAADRPDVETFMTEKSGTAMLVINSVCGCAAGMARPGVRLALAARPPARPRRDRLRRPGSRSDRARPRPTSPDIPPQQPVDRLLQGRRAGGLRARATASRAAAPSPGARPDDALRRALRALPRYGSMGTFHQGKSELHGITVVVDTTGPEIFVGRCDDDGPTAASS